MNEFKRIFGVGPKLVIEGIALVAFTALQPWVHLYFTMRTSFSLLLSSFFVSLFIIGIYYTFRSLPNNERGRVLVTTGAYTYVRHPLYTAGIIFLFPAVTVVAKDWMMLFAGLVLLVIAHWQVREEESAVEVIFGEEYEKYKNTVPPLIPYKFKKK